MIVKPFLKWAGSKTRIAVEIRARLPKGRRLVEPFVGSAALALNSGYDAYLLNDLNPDLIDLYRTLLAEGERFIDFCRAYFTPATNTPAAYAELRMDFNELPRSVERSALFVYLNRHGYNGLCRYNRKGGFNVPFGRYANPRLPEEAMRDFYRLLGQPDVVEFSQGDFAKLTGCLQAGDVVYCDPPYVPLSPSASFTGYSGQGFGIRQQRRLALWAAETAQAGVPVLLSNHDTPLVRQIYAGASITCLQVRRSISCKGDGRGKAGEILALFC